MRRLSTAVVLWSLTVASSFAGQSIVLDNDRSVSNSAFPNIGHSSSVRVEFYIHDWQTGPTRNILYGDSIGIQATLYNIPQQSGPAQMYLFVFSPWDTDPGAMVDLDALFPTTKAAYIRIQRDATAGLLDEEIWDFSGNRVFSQQTLRGTDIPDNQAGVTIAPAGVCDFAFFRIHSTLAPMNSRPPVTVDDEDRLLEWKFDGDLSDSSGNGYWGTISDGSLPSFAPTSHQDVVAAFPKTYGAPIWANWVSMRAGFPNQLDGTQSWSQSDASAAVTCQWSQAPGGPSTLVWDDQTASQPTVSGAVFGTYTFQLTVTDGRGLQGTATLDVGAVAMDDNGVVINADPVVDQIFGPMIAYGKNPWGYADYLAMKATTSRYNDYLSYGLSPTWPYASWQIAQPGTVSYTWDGVGMGPGISAPGTTISSAIFSSGSQSFTVLNVASLDLSELPTRVYVWTNPWSWEEIRICSVNGNSLTPCYDGRGWSDTSNSRLAAQSWPVGAKIGQSKVTGQGTAFLTTLCQAGKQSPAGQVAYSAGTVAVTAGSANVVGIGASWSSTIVLPYDSIRIAATHGGEPFVFVANISSLADATHLLLSRAFPSDADSGTYSYSIITTGAASNRALFPVLHYTRTDGSDAMKYWPNSFGCESDTAMYLYPSWDNSATDAVPYANVSYSVMTGNWWINQSSSGGLDFYGEDLAHRALYYRSGLTLPLTAANMIGDSWVAMPMISGSPVGDPLFNGGLAIGGFADALLSTSGHAVSWSDLRGFAAAATSWLPLSCSAGDSRDTGYEMAWLALAALYDPDTTSGGAPGGIPWQTYWRNQVAPMYTRELSCQRSDSSWASGLYWNPYGVQVALTQGSAVATGTNISTGACAGVASGTGAATNGSGVINGSGFVAGTRIAITGTRSGRPFTAWQYYTVNSSSQITLAQGATWPGDTGAVSWIVDNTTNFLTFMQSNDDPMGAESWSCLRNSPAQITLNRPWDGPSGEYYAYSANIAGIAQQPYMLGIRQAAWRWAALAATAMGDSTLADEFNSLRYAAGSWIRNTGFDSAITNGMYYSRVQAGCEPITPASMGYGGGGPCFDDNPSNSGYDVVAMRELTAEGSPSLWSYYDSGAADRILWGDVAYGSLWGWGPDTAAKVYTPADQLTEQNSQFAASYGLDNGKWTGFFFGMGMAHQWPAIRRGGVQPDNYTMTNVPFALPAGATQVQVTLTAPTGEAGAPFVCTTTCTASLDARLGSYLAHLVYQTTGGQTVSTDDELVLAAWPYYRRR